MVLVSWVSPRVLLRTVEPCRSSPTLFPASVASTAATLCSALAPRTPSLFLLSSFGPRKSERRLGRAQRHTFFFSAIYIELALFETARQQFVLYSAARTATRTYKYDTWYHCCCIPGTYILRRLRFVFVRTPAAKHKTRPKDKSHEYS